MRRREVLKSSYRDGKPQRGVGLKKPMIVAYLCIFKFKKQSLFQEQASRLSWIQYNLLERRLEM